MKRTVLQKPAIACFLGDQQEPSYRGSPKDQAEEALETVRKLGGHASFIQTLTLLREKVVISLLKEMRFFFLNNHKSYHHNFPRGHSADTIQPSPHLLLFCESECNVMTHWGLRNVRQHSG